MKDFLITYWKDLVTLFVALLILFFSAFKKPGKNSPVLEKLYAQLPLIICNVEKVYGAGHGEVKKAAVIDACDSLFYKLSGIHLKESQFYLEIVSEQIEKILSTPSRKEKDEK